MKYKFKITDIVKVIDIGPTYTTYLNWAETKGLTHYRNGNGFWPQADKLFTVIARGRHDTIGVEDALYGIRSMSTPVRDYIIAESGLELIKREGEKKKIHLIPSVLTEDEQ